MSSWWIFYILIIFDTSPFFCHKCGTDFLIKKLNLKANRVPNKITRRRLNNAFTPINILIDATILVEQRDNGILSSYSYTKIQAEFDYLAKYYLRKMIYVQHESYSTEEIINLYEKNCNLKCGHDYHYEYYGEDDPYDLSIFPQIDESGKHLSSDAIMGANPCLFSSNGRPIGGIVYLSKNLISQINSGNKIDIDYHIRNTLFHELFHVLGFIPRFFSKKYTENGYTYLNSPKLLAKAKMHFGCDSLKGLRLEDQGGTGTVGSHWDARYMQGELMIGVDYSEKVLSDMTLAFLEDLGFYKVNYYTGGLFRFGKNEGCSFFKKKCIYSEGTLFPNEFCYRPGEPFCSGSLTSKGYCFIYEYKDIIPKKYRYFSQEKMGGEIMTDYCPISFYSDESSNFFYPSVCYYGKSEYDGERKGGKSICFKSSINLDSKKSICYSVECDRVNKKIRVITDRYDIICDGEKKELIDPNGLKGSLLCPDYNMVCTSDIWCNNIYNCIENNSITDKNTFYYISNKAKLLQLDNEKLKVNDSLTFDINSLKKDNEKSTNDDSNNGLNIKYDWVKLIWQFALIIINFI